MTPQVVFAIPPKAHLLDLNGPAHVFYEAKQLGVDIELLYVAIDQSKALESSAGLAFNRLTSFENLGLGQGDFIIIPGAEADLITNNRLGQKYKPFFSWLQKQSERQVNICSICTGSFILAASGLLRGRACTTHWRYVELFKSLYPTIHVQENRLFVKDEHIYTSAGVSAGIDMSLYILEQRYSPEVVSQISKEMVYPLRRSETDPQLNIFLQYRNHLDTRIHQVQDFMIHHLHQNCKAEVLANQVNMSVRNLSRLFKKKTNMTLGHYLELLRVETAMRLLREGHKVQAVADACGLKSTNQLRTILKKHKSILPSELYEVT